MDEYHSSIFMHQREKKMSQPSLCLNSKLIRKETFNLSKGSSEMEEMEWNNYLWKFNYNHPMLRKWAPAHIFSFYIPKLAHWSDFSTRPHSWGEIWLNLSAWIYLVKWKLIWTMDTLGHSVLWMCVRSLVENWKMWCIFSKICVRTCNFESANTGIVPAFRLSLWLKLLLVGVLMSSVFTRRRYTSRPVFWSCKNRSMVCHFFFFFFKSHITYLTNTCKTYIAYVKISHITEILHALLCLWGHFNSNLSIAEI